MGSPRRFASVASQSAAHARMAPPAFELAAATRSFARFLYCARLGRGGSGSVSMRSSFHCSPGVRSCQAERSFVLLGLLSGVGTALRSEERRVGKEARA